MKKRLGELAGVVSPAYAASKELRLGQLDYRPDIDGLRAVAVLSVLGFHFFPDHVKAGFFGVDIFFVISGYLITGIILSRLKENSFSYVDFYIRRIRRIFPALALVLAVTLALGWAALFADEFKLLGKHVLASAAFVSNFALWRESGYFDAVAETKPLLHLWSLGVEEQFYILWPIIICLAFRKRRSVETMWVIALMSFAANVYLTDTNPVAAFYSPASRFWELMIGALLAYRTVLQAPSASAPGNAKATLGALCLVCGFLVIDRESAFPGWLALLPTVGAGLLIAAGPRAWLNKNVLSHRLLVWLGLISYPLYLWHWPLLSLAVIVAVDPLSVETRIMILLLSTGLAWLTYSLIERPLRAFPQRKLVPVALVGALGTTALLGSLVFIEGGLSSRSIIGQVREAFPIKRVSDQRHTCANGGDLPATLMRACVAHVGQHQKYRVVLWGDSHGTFWASVLAELAVKDDFELIAIRELGCPPLTGVSIPNRVEDSTTCASLEAHSKVLPEILALRPDLVILTARWSFYTQRWIRSGRLEKANTFLTDSASDAATSETSRRALADKIPATIGAFLERKIPVIAIRNPPVLRFPVGNLRKSVPDIEVTRAEHDKTSAFTDEIFGKIVGLEIFDPAEKICDVKCNVRIDDQYLYVDDNHLSQPGVALFIHELEAMIVRHLDKRD